MAIQESINLIQKEVTILEEMGFSFDHNCARSLFGLFSSSILHVTVMSVHNIV
jgi:hypothetical protein